MTENNFQVIPATYKKIVLDHLTRILHVDDDADIRLMVGTVLKLVGGFEVEQFSSGEEAILHAARLKPQMLLLDVMMPNISGYETWSELKKTPELEHIPTVFLTAKHDKNLDQRLLDEGALAVLNKPFDPVALCKTLQRLWKARQTQSC